MTHFWKLSCSDISFNSTGIPWRLLFSFPTHVVFLLRGQLANARYSYTGDPLKCFEFVAIHHSQFDWLNNKHDFLLNRCSMILPFFLVCQHKERFLKYSGKVYGSATSIITHIYMILKVSEGYLMSRGKSFVNWKV